MIVTASTPDCRAHCGEIFEGLGRGQSFENVSVVFVAKDGREPRYRYQVSDSAVAKYEPIDVPVRLGQVLLFIQDQHHRRYIDRAAADTEQSAGESAEESDEQQGKYL